MRLIYTFDKCDYDTSAEPLYRPSTRGIIIENHMVTLLYSQKYDFFEFPGGGIKPGESHIDALVREIREETGLTVMPDSIVPYGNIRRKQKGKYEPLFIQDNFFFFCKVKKSVSKPHLTQSEMSVDFVTKKLTISDALEHMRLKVAQSPDDMLYKLTLFVLNNLFESLSDFNEN